MDPQTEISLPVMNGDNKSTPDNDAPLEGSREKTSYQY